MLNLSTSLMLLQTIQSAGKLSEDKVVHEKRVSSIGCNFKHAPHRIKIEFCY